MFQINKRISGLYAAQENFNKTDKEQLGLFDASELDVKAAVDFAPLFCFRLVSICPRGREQ
jgi:hypothetical protein